MLNQPSRRQIRESKLYYAAEKGKLQLELNLYNREARSLKKDGFKVVQLINNNASLPKYGVSWETPFKKGIPPIVFSYTIGEIETFPKNLNWAQELYAIATRANNKVSQKTSE